MSTLTEDTRERTHMVYEVDRYLISEPALIMKGYTCERIYSVTDHDVVYVRHILINDETGARFGYDWGKTLVDPKKLVNAQHIKRNKYRRLDLSGRD